MARASIRFAAIATCIAFCLSAEDRQARSGDLDRGPVFSFIQNKKNVDQDDVKSEGEKTRYNHNFHTPFDGDIESIHQNYLSKFSPLENIYGGNAQESPLQNFESKQLDSNVDYTVGSYETTSEETPKKQIKELLSVEKKIEGTSELQQEFYTTSDILHRLSNLRFKLPLRDEFNISNSTDPFLQQKPRRMRSGPLDIPNYNKVAKEPAEISFEVTNEDAMALKRRVELSTEFFLIPSSSSPATSTRGVHITKTVNSNEKFEYGVFRNEVWVIPVIALSIVTMVLIAGFEVFVLCKAWRTTPSRRHLFLGQMLLLGLFSCAGLSSVIAASPTRFTCALMRFGTGVAYTIVFASLLVKCVFLISLNGGVYLPAPYQGLLLLFAVLIQVAIGAQWLLTSPPVVESITVEQVVQQNKNRLLVTAADISTARTIPLCGTPYVDMVLSLIYVIFLIVFVTVLAVKSRGIRDNYREATYIGLSVGCSIPTWLMWTVSGFVVNERHRDACVAFGLVIISIMVFLIMFMPKGRQLAAMGKEGVYIEDREERFSSLSRTASGYSPSFFHFKPIKYGINNSSKHQHIATLGGNGDMAIYPPPPSYNRYYQYYSSPPGYYSTRYLPGVYLRPEDCNLYTTLEPTLSSNPNVYFQRGNGLHPGMMY